MSGRGQTPARVTRSASRANTPLPALQTRQSHAYGAAGKASLQSQVTTSHDQLDEAFTATARPSQEPAVPRTTRGKKSQSVVDEQPEPEPETVEEPTEPTIDDRPGTSLQDSALYAQQHAPIRPPPPVPKPHVTKQHVSERHVPERHVTKNQQHVTTRPTAPVAPVSPPHARTPRRPVQRQQSEIEPPHWKIFFRTLWQFSGPGCILFFFWLISAIGLVVLSLTLFAIMPLPTSLAPARDRIVLGTRIALDSPGHGEIPEHLGRQWDILRHRGVWVEDAPEWSNATIGEQYILNMYMLERINTTAKHVNYLHDVIASQDRELAGIQQLLPHGLALVKQNGEYVIPAQFWEALLARMSSEDASPLWDAFITANNQKIEQMQEGIVLGKLSKAVSEHHLVTETGLQAVLEDNRRSLEVMMNEKLASMEDHLMHQARLMVADVARDILVRDVSDVSRFNVVHDLEKRLHERNFLSPAFGALVDPRITSKTFKELSAMQYLGLYAMWMTGLGAYGLTEMPKHPPSVALLGWEEATQSWCSAHEGSVGAQLGVQLAHKIHPEFFVIEHIPSQATLDIAAAPRNWELWAQVENETEAARVNEVLANRMSFFKLNPCGPSPKPVDGKPWVCLTTNEYDIHKTEYIKHYEVDYARTNTDPGIFFTDKIIFKVLDNWGSPDHTCIYRVRLTGELQPAAPAEPPVEF